MNHQDTKSQRRTTFRKQKSGDGTFFLLCSLIFTYLLVALCLSGDPEAVREILGPWPKVGPARAF
jgi:hypothetical protein